MSEEIVSEAGVYRMIITMSAKPEAQRFARWVFHEVLPEIRRTGSYRGTPGAVAAMLAEMGIPMPGGAEPT